MRHLANKDDEQIHSSSSYRSIHLVLSIFTILTFGFAHFQFNSQNGKRLRLHNEGDSHDRLLQTSTTTSGSCAGLGASSNCICDDLPAPKTIEQEIGEWFAVFILLFLSACFSGLNLGLMSLDLSGLEIVANGSDEKNARYAKAIIPVRKHHNWLLTTLLLGNVMVNSLISILLADKTTGVVGFIISTAAIVLLGEVFPQALSSRHPLYVGYHSLYLVYFFMAALYVVARPLSVILDKVLGSPIGTIYAHEEFAHLVEMHRQAGALDEDQTKIMKGALDFKHSCVEECMTPIGLVYSLEVDEVVDRKKLKEIFTSGYSRVPVHNKSKETTVGIILTKDLILVDPRDRRTVGEIAEIFERTPLFFHPDTSLGKALALFKGGKSHCAVVEEVNSRGQKRTVGFVTLEDVLEELLDSEIHDETEDAVQQRFITLDPSFSDRIEEPRTVRNISSIHRLRRKGGQSPEIAREAERKADKLSRKVAPEDDYAPVAQKTSGKPTSLIRKLTPANRLARVLTDVTNVLGVRLQEVVRENAFLTSLGLSLSDTNSLSNLTIHLSGDVDVGSLQVTTPWYAPVRDSYNASFLLSAVPKIEEGEHQFNGISRRVAFNSEDTLRVPTLANDVPHPVFKRTVSDPSMPSPIKPNISRPGAIPPRFNRDSLSSDHSDNEDDANREGDTDLGWARNDSRKLRSHSQEDMAYS